MMIPYSSARCRCHTPSFPTHFLSCFFSIFDSISKLISIVNERGKNKREFESNGSLVVWSLNKDVKETLWERAQREDSTIEEAAVFKTRNTRVQ